MANDNGRKDAAAVMGDLCGDPTMADEARREVASENELKPCPFCGGKARMSAWVEQSEYSAYCTKCGATAGDYRATEAEAVEAWNRRDGVGVSKTETTTKGNLGVGGAARMREALEFVRDWLVRQNTERFSGMVKSKFACPASYYRDFAKETIEDNQFHIDDITAALSAPPRNCDTIPWRVAWKKWLKANGVAIPRSYAEAKSKTTAFLDWYTGEAKEGGNDGNE